MQRGTQWLHHYRLVDGSIVIGQDAHLSTIVDACGRFDLGGNPDRAQTVRPAY